MRLKLVAPILLTAAAAQELPVIQVTTRLVEVNVVVRDGKGPVTNLTGGDFTLFDQGHPQKIAFVQRNGATNAPAAAPAPKATPVPTPGTFTNQAGPASPISTVIVLDSIFTNGQDALQCRPKLRKFLQEVRATDRVAIFVVGGGLRIAQPFTGDSKQLTDALDVQQWGSGHLASARRPSASFVRERSLSNAELAAIVRAASLTFVSNNITPFAKSVKNECIALVSLARYLSRIPGHKNVMWITGGFPLVKWSDEPELFADELRQVTRAFNDADAAMYPIGASGVLPMVLPAPPARYGAVLGAKPSIGSGTAALPMGGKGSPALASPGSETEGMFNYVAQYTGGKPFFQTNDITEPIRKTFDEAVASYTVGFYPDAARLDSKWHELKVVVARKGVVMSFRPGYTASVEPPAKRIPEQAEITEALWGTADATGIPLTARAEKVDQPQPGMLRLNLSLPAEAVAFQRDEQGWSGVLAVVYDQKSMDGKDLGRISETLNMQYDEEHHQKLAADGVTFTKLVHPSPQAAQLRIVVYDRNSGRIGSVAVKL